MNAALRPVMTREQVIEDCLRALAAVQGEESIPAEVRHKAAWFQADLHACRSAETVARMELERGISPSENAA